MRRKLPQYHLPRMQFGKLCWAHVTYRLVALEGIPASPDDDGGVDDGDYENDYRRAAAVKIVDMKSWACAGFNR